MSDTLKAAQAELKRPAYKSEKLRLPTNGDAEKEHHEEQPENGSAKEPQPEAAATADKKDMDIEPMEEDLEEERHKGQIVKTNEVTNPGQQAQAALGAEAETENEKTAAEAKAEGEEKEKAEAEAKAEAEEQEKAEAEAKAEAEEKEKTAENAQDPSKSEPCPTVANSTKMQQPLQQRWSQLPLQNLGQRPRQSSAHVLPRFLRPPLRLRQKKKFQSRLTRHNRGAQQQPQKQPQRK